MLNFTATPPIVKLYVHNLHTIVSKLCHTKVMAKSKKAKIELNNRVSPNCIYSLKDERLGSIAKAMLVRLVHLSFDMEEIFYSNAKLASDLNISLRTSVNALNELEKRGYIRRSKSHPSGTKITEIDHERIITRLFEEPQSPRHLAWLKGYYKMPKKLEGRYV